jgi:hypothetical protein
VSIETTITVRTTATCPQCERTLVKSVVVTTKELDAAVSVAIVMENARLRATEEVAEEAAARGWLAYGGGELTPIGFSSCGQCRDPDGPRRDAKGKAVSK